MLNVLILGSEGFVGHNLVKGLEKQFNILTADQLDISSHRNYTKFDIANPSSVKKTLKDVDVIINLVAHSLVSSIDDIIKNAEVNIIGLLNVLESARINNVKKIIFTSASSLVGEPVSFSVAETHNAKPKTAYGITKLSSEHYLRLYHELYGLDFVVFRFFNIYGPFQKNGIIPSLYQRLTNNEPITIFGDGNQIRDYVYIEDVVHFFEKSLSTNIANNKIINMGTGKGTSIKELVDVTSKIMSKKPIIENKPPRPGEIGNFIADTTLLQSLFNETPTTKIEEGLTKTIEWLRHN